MVLMLGTFANDGDSRILRDVSGSWPSPTVDTETPWAGRLDTLIARI